MNSLPSLPGTPPSDKKPAAVQATQADGAAEASGKATYLSLIAKFEAVLQTQQGVAKALLMVECFANSSPEQLHEHWNIQGNYIQAEFEPFKRSLLQSAKALLQEVAGKAQEAAQKPDHNQMDNRKPSPAEAAQAAQIEKDFEELAKDSIIGQQLKRDPNLLQDLNEEGFDFLLKESNKEVEETEKTHSSHLEVVGKQVDLISSDKSEKRAAKAVNLFLLLQSSNLKKKKRASLSTETDESKEDYEDGNGKKRRKPEARAPAPVPFPADGASHIGTSTPPSMRRRIKAKDPADPRPAAPQPRPVPPLPRQDAPAAMTNLFAAAPSAMTNPFATAPAASMTNLFTAAPAASMTNPFAAAPAAVMTNPFTGAPSASMTNQFTAAPAAIASAPGCVGGPAFGNTSSSHENRRPDLESASKRQGLVYESFHFS
ncbi:MAG: hypothetical protein SGILL_007344 [Bacillariaceae sp.]